MVIDFTGIAVTVIGGFFSVLSLVVSSEITAHIKDVAARAQVQSVVSASLGTMQQMSELAAKGIPPITVPITGLPASLVSAVPFLQNGVQHVLDNAGPEVDRLGYTPAVIASKIVAQLGLVAIASNVQAAASPGPTPPPLAPVAALAPVKAAIAGVPRPIGGTPM